MSYRGTLPKPEWVDTEKGKTCDRSPHWCLLHEIGLFSTLCTVRADTSKIAQKLTPKRSPEGSMYFALEIKVVLLFGLTELKAVISWQDEVSHHFLDTTASLTPAPQEEEIRQVSF